MTHTFGADFCELWL